MNEKYMAVIGIIIILIVAYGGWTCSRYVNYKLQYEDMVLNTIKENVKSECIK